MKSQENFFQIDNYGWPKQCEPISFTFLKFDFKYNFTEKDIEMLKDGYMNQFFTFQWAYVSNEKIYIYKGSCCLYQICINLSQVTHTAVYYFYDDVDKDHTIDPQEQLLVILSKWFHHGWHPVVDCHGHYNFDIDDGSLSLEMSVDMIRRAQNHGVSDIICTSHSWGSLENYKSNLSKLQFAIKNEKIEIRLHPGTEIFCTEKMIPKIIDKLNAGYLLPLGTSKHILLEFDCNVNAIEILRCVKQLSELTDYVPVIAHAERYYNLADDVSALQILKNWKIPIQINAYSLVEEKNPIIRDFARKLLSKGMVRFVGSDAHRTTHRPPNIASGTEFIYKHCNKEYADAICFANAKRLLLKNC